MHILIVEDEIHIKSMLARLLTAKGHQVRTAGDGAEAWQIFSEDAAGIDLVLADLRMPVLDGLGLLNRIRASGNGKPCVLMTGHADLSPEEQEQLGAARVLNKPFTRDEIIDAVASVEQRS